MKINFIFVAFLILREPLHSPRFCGVIAMQ